STTRDFFHPANFPEKGICFGLEPEIRFTLEQPEFDAMSRSLSIVVSLCKHRFTTCLQEITRHMALSLLRSALITLPLAAGVAAHAQAPVIVDNTDPGFSVVTGEWLTGTGAA